MNKKLRPRMPRRFTAVSGFVLTGGESRRMGSPKDQLMLGGETMLARQVRLLRRVTRLVAVVGRSSAKVADLDVIPDDYPEIGPLGGIATALGRTRTEYNLFLGCDLPLIEERFLQFLCREAMASEADATVPGSADRKVHPVCAVYRRRALKPIRLTLGREDFSVRSFFPHVKLRVVSWLEIAHAGFGRQIFENMNTPDDYDRMKGFLRISG